MDGPLAILNWGIHLVVFVTTLWLIYRALDPESVTDREKRLTTYGGVVAIATVVLAVVTPLPYLGNPVVVTSFGVVLAAFPMLPRL